MALSDRQWIDASKLASPTAEQSIHSDTAKRARARGRYNRRRRRLQFNQSTTSAARCSSTTRHLLVLEIEIDRRPGPMIRAMIVRLAGVLQTTKINEPMCSCFRTTLAIKDRAPQTHTSTTYTMQDYEEICPSWTHINPTSVLF